MAGELGRPLPKMETIEIISKKFDFPADKEGVVNLPFRRKVLAEFLKELNYKVGAEIGTDLGLFAETLCQSNPEMKLYCIDPWRAYDKYEDMKDQVRLNQNYFETQKRLAPYNCEILRESSTGALKHFPQRSLDFVYIDGNHAYEYVLEDLNGWSKVVKEGGIISGHDYRSDVSSHGKWDVTKAVKEYMAAHDIKTLYLFVRRYDSSWFFINK